MLTELSAEIIESMLVNQFFGRIACAAEGRILIEPVAYYYDGHCILGLTREGTKTEILHKNSRVALEIDEMVSLNDWRSVVIEGTYEELAGDDRDYALYLLKNLKIPVFANENWAIPVSAGQQPRRWCIPWCIGFRF